MRSRLVARGYSTLRGSATITTTPRYISPRYSLACLRSNHPSSVRVSIRQYGGWSASTGSPRTQQLISQHARDIDSIASTIRSFAASNTPYRIAHGSTNSTRAARAPGTPVVDISKLNRVLSVDRASMTALVEPNVPMDRLVEATLPYGLIPPVVMEFPGITAGGGFAGTCGESSSFRHGFFNQTLRRVEMVDARGEVIYASPEENPDLFAGAAGALGTLGVTTCVEIQLIKAEKFVETTYHPVVAKEGAETNIDAAVALSQDFATRDDIDYLDGILLSPTRGAIITGKMTSSPSSPSLPTARFSAPSDPWFYQHVDAHLRRSPTAPITELIPLPQYLFRYDRGGFWVARAAFSYFSFPFNALTRWYLDDFLHTRMLYSALHASGQSDTYFVQDFGLPFDHAADFLRDSQRVLGGRIWPVWLCPLRMAGVEPGRTFHPHGRTPSSSSSPSSKPLDPQPSHILNIGLYGQPPTSGPSFTDLNRSINALLDTHGGTKWLYAQSFYTPDELWDVYPKEWYDSLRAKYHAIGLPSVSDKVGWDGKEPDRKREVWPMAGVKGLRAAIASRSYLDARKSSWKYWS